MKSTKLLMLDHEVILQALQILQAMNDAIREGKNVNAEDIRSLLTFLREFADGCHHVKEEAIFFPALMQAGFAGDDGPLRAMNLEHERGRTLVAAMEHAISRDTNTDFLMYSSRYVDLLSEHIDKEDRIVFERADEILSDDEDQKIADDFEHYETVVVGAPAHERLHRIIEPLADKYLVTTVR
jgi:hemerythrin-like domain-containing protein